MDWQNIDWSEIDWEELGLLDMALDLVGAIVILFLGLTIAGRVGRLIRRLGQRYQRFDVTLMDFLGTVARYALIILTIIVVLGQFGIQTTSLVALIGAAGLAVGLALQGTLSNLAAGVMLLAFRPFKIGDYVEAGGESGTVEQIDLFTTKLVSPDNVLKVVPNGDVWGGAIINYSAKPERRLDLVFGVSYDTDLKAAEQALRDVIAADDRIRSVPAEPFVKVSNLGDSSVDFTLRLWCKASDYWPLKFDLTRAVKDTFDERGIEIPFPTTTFVTPAPVPVTPAGG